MEASLTHFLRKGSIRRVGYILVSNKGLESLLQLLREQK
jgi:hypothetical protein